MLSSDLLRTKTYRGKIIPIFCNTTNSSTDYAIANKIIKYFAEAQKSHDTKGALTNKITTLESQHDYKLVRGLYTLLERRSNFVIGHYQSLSIPATTTPTIVRRRLYEESSRLGLALTDLARKDVINSIANKMHLDSAQIEDIMWADKDENLILSKFDAIPTQNLIWWYNQSLAQTLLFRCTGLQFYVQGGVYWKQILRNIKRYGLMYLLEYNNTNDAVTCTLDGPLSLFRMTDRYGTSLAKILPMIITTPTTWKIAGSIIKKTDAGPKVYRFKLSNKDTTGIFGSVINSTLAQEQHNDTATAIYDSVLESTFAKKFYQHFDKNDKLGWRITREPDPLVADGKAMIPDFLFEKFERKVYLEIVGFWTKDYLDRKAAKLKAIFDQMDPHDVSSADPSSTTTTTPKVDLLVAINQDLACSQIENISHDRIFTFKKDVSIKPILDHLRKIDAQIIHEKTRNTKIDLDKYKNLDLISIHKVSCDYNIPPESALALLTKHYPHHIITGLYMVSPTKIKIITQSLANISKFVDACSILESLQIPDSSHADLLSKLGYNVVWCDLDPRNAKIVAVP